MKFFYMPGTCAIGIHVLLEEIGKPFEIELVDFAARAQYKAGYTAINPKSKVPALLRDDGSVLTEFPAIAWYLARSNPAAGLLGEGIEAEARTLELVDYMVATVHMRGFTRIFRPGAFTPTNADEPAIQQTGRDIATEGLRLLSATLGAKPYLLGDYSIADAALFFLEYWAAGRAAIKLPANIEAHFARMKERPAVRRALAAEGLA